MNELHYKDSVINGVPYYTHTKGAFCFRNSTALGKTMWLKPWKYISSAENNYKSFLLICCHHYCFSRNLKSTLDLVVIVHKDRTQIQGMWGKKGDPKEWLHEFICQFGERATLTILSFPIQKCRIAVHLFRSCNMPLSNIL